MNDAIGSILPLAVGVAISPVPIIAVVLILLSRNARSSSIGFLLGWIAGIVLSLAVMTGLSTFLPQRDSDAGHPLEGVLKIALGALLLFLAYRQWQKRPKRGEEPKLPKWMNSIDSATFRSALGLSFTLAAVNPKNLILNAHAGLEATTHSLDLPQILIVLAVYLLIATCTVVIPVLAFQVAADRLRPALEGIHGWLARENGTIMAVLLLVLGASGIGNGIALL